MQAASGLLSITGTATGESVRCGHGITDVTSGLFAVIGILLALRARESTGQGQYVDLSQAECSIHMIGRAVLEYTVNGRVQTRMGNALREYAPSGVYPCAGTDRRSGLNRDPSPRSYRSAAAG